MVCRELHDERSGIACEHFRLLQHDAGDDDGRDADEVRGGRDQRAVVREERTRDQRDDGKLRAAGDEGRRHDGHAAVALVLDRPGSHDARDAAAGADHHRDEGLAGEAEPSEDTVHDERDTRHVAAALKECQEEEQDEHLGNEAQDRADTADDTVNDQAGEPGCHAGAFEQAADAALQPLADKYVIRPVRDDRADRRDGEVVNDEHDQREDRERQPSVRHDAVDLVRCREFAGLLFAVRTLQDAADVGVAVVGDQGFRVVIQFLLGGSDVLFDVCLDVRRQVQLLKHLLIALKDLDRVPVLLRRRELAFRRLFDVRDRVLDGAGELVLRDGLRVLRGVDHSLGGLFDAGTLQGGDLHDLAAEFLFQLLRVDLIAVLAHDVHHVQRDHDRDAELDELGRQVQVALQIRRVNDVEDRVRELLDQVVSRDDFFQCVRGERVDAGKVRDDHVAVSLQLALFLLDGDAGPVADVLVGAGQRVEQCGFAAVRVAGQCNSDTHLFPPFGLPHCCAEIPPHNSFD